MRTSPAGVELIKSFEGLVLEAYPDPGTGGDPWTIGYGHTGPEVKPGLTVDIEQAESLLNEDLRKFEEAVERLIIVEINQNEFDALVSFAYNCGWFALEDSTLRRRLNAGEIKCPVFKEELPKWVNGGNGPMPGLVRRREAEAELACAPVSSTPKSFLEDAAKYYKELPHQRAAWRELEASPGTWSSTQV
jgi:GH24 family phage-related lysozyme (muramidase)